MSKESCVVKTAVKCTSMAFMQSFRSVYFISYLSVDQRDADPVIVEEQAALGSVIIQLLQRQ